MAKVFISYRRQDTAGHAGRLADRLRSEFGPANVFMDVDAIGFGEEFAKRIEEGVASCDVLLVMIGHQWLTLKDESGQRRLDNVQDFVRLEVEAGLDRDVWVIPVLVEGTSLPETKDLPESMAKLASHQAIELRNNTWRDDVNRLIRAIWDLSTKRGVRPKITRARARLRSAPRAVKAGALTFPLLLVAAALFLSGVIGGGSKSSALGGVYAGTTSQGSMCQGAINKSGWSTGPGLPCVVRLTFSKNRKTLVDVNDLRYSTTCAGHPITVDFFFHNAHAPVVGSSFQQAIRVPKGPQLIFVSGRFAGQSEATGTLTTKNDIRNGVPCRSISTQFRIRANSAT